MNTPGQFPILVAMVLWALSGPIHAELVSKVFPLGDADPREVEEAVRSSLSSKGRTVLLIRERKLLVQDEAENLPMAESIIRQLTAPRPNVRVEVMFGEAGESLDRQVEVRGRIGGRDLNLRRGQDPSITIEGGHRSSGTHSMSGQFVVVQSGRTASIRVVQEVPLVDYFYQYAVGRGYITAETRWRALGSQLAVTPRVVGDFIEVEILPQITALDDARDGTVSFRELATRVTVANGKTVQVGGFQGAGEEFNRNFFSGGGRRSGATAVGFHLRATVF